MDNRHQSNHSSRGQRRSHIAYLLVGACLGAAAVWLGMRMHGDLDRNQHVRQLEGQLQQLTTDLAQSIAQRDMLEGHLAVEASTRQGLALSLQKVQNELGVAHEQIAFFEELLPPGPMGAISIRGFDVQRVGRSLQYKVLLMRRGAGEQTFHGHLQFQAKGDSGGKTVVMNLLPVQADSVEELDQTSSVQNVLGLNFDRFQRSAGVLEIPADFNPLSVTVNVLEGKTVRVSRTMEMPVLQPEN